MQFTVPQFIDIEPKVIGPITPRQFITLLIGGGFIFICYKLADFTLFILEALIILFFSFLFAFYRVNGRPFHEHLLNIFQTLRHSSLRVWAPEIFKEKELKVKESLGKEKITPRKTLTSHRLSEVSLTVDTGGVFEEE